MVYGLPPTDAAAPSPALAKITDAVVVEHAADSAAVVGRGAVGFAVGVGGDVQVGRLHCSAANYRPWRSLPENAPLKLLQILVS